MGRELYLREGEREILDQVKTNKKEPSKCKNFDSHFMELRASSFKVPKLAFRPPIPTKAS